jgi:SAM-dependent methyltransferase
MLKKVYKSYGEYAQKWAERKKGGDAGSHEYLEKPAMMAALGDVMTGKTILCLGCGTGEECRMIKDMGAGRVVGVDKEYELIQVAKRAYADIEFDTMPMEALNFPEDTFDIVYSSLVMHYAPDWTVPLAQVRKVLKKDGVFLFSTHHPIWWGAERTREGDKFITHLGAAKIGNNKNEIYGDYLTNRKIEDVWFNEFEVSYYHKPLSEIITEIVASGLTIKSFIEPKPVEEAKSKKFNFWAIHQKIPLFMIFELQK